MSDNDSEKRAYISWPQEPKDLLEFADRLAGDSEAQKQAQSGLDEPFSLAADQDELEPIGQETVESYVDGRMDPVDAEIFEARMELDPGLRREVSELTDLRAGLQAFGPPSYASKPAPAAFLRVVAGGWKPALGLAAAALLALFFLHPKQTAPTPELASRPNPILLPHDADHLPTPSELLGPSPHHMAAPTHLASEPPLDHRSTEPGAVAVTHHHRSLRTHRHVSVPLELAPQPSADAVHALETGTVTVPDDAVALASGGDEVRGDTGGPVRLIGPAKEVVRSDRPEFTWTSSDIIASYKVEVADSAGNPTASRDRLTTNSWKPGIALPRGVPLTWSVIATPKDQSAEPTASGPATFEVLSGPALASVEQAEQKYAKDPLSLGVAYAKAGLVAEAIQSLGKVESRHPRKGLEKLIGELRKPVKR